MQILKKITINAPIETVWKTIGTEYEHAGRWSSAVYASASLKGQPVGEAPVLGRVCETTLGPFQEEIVAFDASGKTLAYVASGEKMPGFVKQLKGTWTLARRGHGTEVTMAFHADIAPPFNVLMGWMMRLQFVKAIDASLGDLKFFLENNAPHPRKVKFDASQKAAKARRALAA